MASEDDFDALYEAYRAKKRTDQTSVKQSSFKKNNREELPLWKEVKPNVDDDECDICKRNFVNDDIVESCLSCGRYFHYKHIREWLKIRGSCPVCKQ